MTNIQQASLNTKSTTTLRPSELHFGIDWSFKMRYCIPILVEVEGYTVPHYKLQSMPKWSSEGLSVVALLVFKLAC